MKVLNRVGISLIAGVLGTSLMASSVFAAPLHPVSHPDWLVKEKIISGTATGDLQLDKPVTLAEVVTILSRVKEAKVEKGKSGHWATPYLMWAKSQGAIADNQVRVPAATVSSAELTKIAKRVGIELKLEDAAKVTHKDFYQALGEAITTHVTIAHTNDVHGHIEENANGKEFGYAKIATLVKEWRAENPNFLLMDAGDTFQGTVFVNQFKGESIVPILNSLNYNAQAAGNHEFDFGFEQLLKLKDMVKHPIISSNVYTADGKTLLVPTYTTEIGGEKYTFVGFVAEDTPILTHPDNVKGLTFKSPVEVAKQIVPELKKQADHVIVVSHIGIDVDREIAKAVPGIDLIIGGHSHTPLQKPENVNGTYIVQDWEYGKSLGRADLYYYDDKLVGFSGGLVEYSDKVQADPEVDKLVKEVVGKVDSVMNVVIGKSEVDLDGDRALVRTRETNVGNFIADTMLAKSKTIKGHEADVALTNAGGIRVQLKAGDLTKKDLYSLLPFPNTVVVVEATGDELKKALENGVSQVETGAGRFPQISGMSFTYDPAQPAGQRVVEVKVGGQPLDLTKTYKVATNDFIASGGDGYEALKKNFFNTGFTLYDVVEEAITSQKTIKPQVENRIVSLKK